MATFIDLSGDDIYLLHQSVRDHDERFTVADNVEWEILNYYKQRPSIPLVLKTGYENLDNVNEIDVRLVDYDDDNPANSEADLKEALKRTIADVASWVLRNYDNTQGAQSITQGKRSISFGSAVPSWRDWPDGWSYRLKNFDDKEAVYSI